MTYLLAVSQIIEALAYIFGLAGGVMILTFLIGIAYSTLVLNYPAKTKSRKKK